MRRLCSLGGLALVPGYARRLFSFSFKFSLTSHPRTGIAWRFFLHLKSPGGVPGLRGLGLVAEAAEEFVG